MANTGRSASSPKPTPCGATRKNPTSGGARRSGRSKRRWQTSTSLRAQRSNPSCSEESVDCFVATLLAMTKSPLKVARMLRPNSLQLLQTARHANLGRHRRVGKAGLPVGAADFAEIEAALEIERNAVGREEFSRLQPSAILAAEPGDALAFGIDDRKPRPEIRRLEVDRHAGAKLADNEIRMLAAAAMQRAGPVQIV